MRKATMKRVVDQNVVMIDNIMGILADRYGLTQEQLEIIDDAIRSMSVTDFANGTNQMRILWMLSLTLPRFMA